MRCFAALAALVLVAAPLEAQTAIDTVRLAAGRGVLILPAPPPPPPAPPPAVTLGQPFGFFYQPTFDSLWTGGDAIIPRTGLATIAQAKRAGARVFVNVTGGGACAVVNGKFQMAAWRACFDKHAPTAVAGAIQAYHDSGAVAAIYLIDEPNHPSRWGPAGTITPAMVEEMAAHVKTRMPRVPIAVRAGPDWLAGPGRPAKYVALDLAWAQFAWRRTRSSAVAAVTQYRDTHLATARQLGLGMVFSLNALHGGATNPTDPLFEGFMPDGDLYAMGPKELRRYGEVFIGSGCAFLLWEYLAAYATHPKIAPELQSLARLARQAPAKPCTRGTA